jgi:hypothetical protein
MWDFTRRRRYRQHSLLALLLSLVGVCLSACEEPQDSSSNVPITTQPTTRRTPASNPFAAVTQPTTTAAASRPVAADDPLATPQRSIAYMFELMSKEDIEGLRTMMADPLPTATLRGEVRGVADRLASGAKWEIADTKVSGVAALVIVRTTFPDGKLDLAPLVLVNRYERWKVLLGTPTQATMRRFTTGEKESMNRVLEWGVERMAELRGLPTTKTATTTAPSTSTTTP